MENNVWRFVRSLSVAAAVLCVTQVRAEERTPSPRAPPLEEFRSTEGKYSIRFPCRAEEAARDLEVQPGLTVALHQATCGDDASGMYQVTWSDRLKGDSATPAERAKLVMDGAINGMNVEGAKVRVDRNVASKWEGLASREADATVTGLRNGRSLRVRLRVVVSKTRGHTVMAFEPEGSPPRAQAFLDSLHVLK